MTNRARVTATIGAMNKLAPIALAAVLATAVASQAACFGSYGAFHTVHDWNATVSGNKWVNSGVHLLLWVVPVYPLTIIGDFLIFNTIEHLTGSNPLR